MVLFFKQGPPGWPGTPGAFNLNPGPPGPPGCKGTRGELLSMASENLKTTYICCFAHSHYIRLQAYEDHRGRRELLEYIPRDGFVRKERRE